MVVDILHAAELLDKLPGALGADARHPGDAVGAVPLDGLDIDELAGGDAVVLLDFGHVVQGDLGLAELGGGQPHRGGAADQLQAVPILHQQLLQHRHLLGQLLGHALAVGLVPRIGLVAEGGRLLVKGDGHPVGGGLLQQLIEHGQKAVDAVGVVPGLGGEHLNAVKGPV